MKECFTCGSLIELGQDYVFFENEDFCCDECTREFFEEQLLDTLHEVYKESEE